MPKKPELQPFDAQLVEWFDLLPPNLSRARFLRNFAVLTMGSVTGLVFGRVFSNEFIDHYNGFEKKVDAYLQMAWQRGITGLDWGVYPHWHGSHGIFYHQINAYQEMLPLKYLGTFITFEELNYAGRVEDLTYYIRLAHSKGLKPIVSVGNGQNYLSQAHMFHPENREVLRGQIQQLVAFLSRFDQPIVLRPWFEMNIAAPYGAKWFGKGYGLTDAEHVRYFQECWALLYDEIKKHCPYVEIAFSPSAIPKYPFAPYVPRDLQTGQLLCDLAGLDIYDMNFFPWEITNPYYIQGWISPDELVYGPLLQLGELVNGEVEIGLMEFNTYSHDPRSEILVASAVAAAGGSFISHFDIPKTSPDPDNYLGVRETNWVVTQEQMEAMQYIQSRLAGAEN